MHVGNCAMVRVACGVCVQFVHVRVAHRWWGFQCRLVLSDAQEAQARVGHSLRRAAGLLQSSHAIAAANDASAVIDRGAGDDRRGALSMATTIDGSVNSSSFVGSFRAFLRPKYLQVVLEDRAVPHHDRE